VFRRLQQIVVNIFDLIPGGKIMYLLCKGDHYGLCSVLAIVKMVMSVS